MTANFLVTIHKHLSLNEPAWLSCWNNVLIFLARLGVPGDWSFQKEPSVTVRRCKWCFLQWHVIKAHQSKNTKQHTLSPKKICQLSVENVCWGNKSFTTSRLLAISRRWCFLISDRHDYCQLETFNATCAEGEIIVMESAMYGRMRAGRCITRSYGNLGCAANVLPALDQKCSGKRSCTVPVPDPILHKNHPCPRDFTSYLEADYQCVKGEWMRFIWHGVCRFVRA